MPRHPVRPSRALLLLAAATVALVSPPLAGRRAQAEVQGLCFGRPETSVAVRDAAELRQAIGDAACGTEIVLAPGHYAGEFAARQQCAADRPLVVRAAPGARRPSPASSGWAGASPSSPA
jgi:hypothetical protein